MASMKNAIVLLADGFEEMEVVIPVDLMRRAGIHVQLVSMNDALRVTGSRDMILEADMSFLQINENYLQNNLPDAIVLPGGLNGSLNLSNHTLTEKLLNIMLSNEKIVAVICAAPIIVLAPLGLLDGKNFTCYPGMEKESKYLQKADISGHKADRVVIDGNLLTSQGPGSAADFAFALIELLLDKEKSEKVKEGALFL